MAAGTDASGASPRKRRKKSELLRCDECCDVVEGWAEWERHLRHNQYCSEVDAQCAPCEPEKEAAQLFCDHTTRAEYEKDVQTHLVDAYATLTYDNLVERTTVQNGIKESLVAPLVDKMKAEIYRRLAQTPAERQTLEQQIGTVFDVHRGIETTAKEETALRRSINPVEPVKRELVDQPDTDGKATGPRSGDFVYDVPIREELEAMAKANPRLLAEFKAASDSWARERPTVGSSREIYVDIPDGAVMRNHAELGTHADRSDGSVRLAVILYYDDLEVVNPLGAFHGRHKLGMFYWALVNEAPETRMAFHNLHLATVALVSDVDYYGISQIVSGLDGDSSFGSCMTALHDSIHVAGVLIRGWVVVVSADYPAAGLLAGFKKSVSANLFCRECDCNRAADEYPAPNSFLEENTHLEQLHLLREREEYETQLAHYMTLSTTAARTAYLSSIGVGTFHEHAFTRIPLFDLCTMIPYDFMHVELEGQPSPCSLYTAVTTHPIAFCAIGSLKNELAAMFYYFIGWSVVGTHAMVALPRSVLLRFEVGSGGG